MIRIAIADDHELYRDGLAALLNSHQDFDVVAQAASGPQILELATALQPDLVTLDVDMGEWPVDRTIRAIRRAAAATAIVILTMHGDRIIREQALNSGADVFLTKTIPKKDMLHELSGALSRPRTPQTEEGKSLLTAREQDVLQLISLGRSNREIAAWLCIAEGTVKRHTGNIYEKLGARSRGDAVRRAGLLHIL